LSKILGKKLIFQTMGDKITMDLSPLLNPQSIAIVGVSGDFSTIGGKLFKTLVNHGYKGKIFPINPEYEEIGGIKCYRSISDINSEIDAVLVAVPDKGVTGVIEESAKKKIKSAIIYSAGFSELSRGGKRSQEQIVDLAKKYNLLICGPNSVGIIDFHNNIAMSFSQFLDLPQLIPGNIAFVSQSGSLGETLINRAQDNGIGISYFISTGNEAVLELSDYIECLLDDPHTLAIIALIEGIRNVEKLLSVADSALEKKRPIIVMKVGRTAIGRKAVSSHTGLVAGSDAVYEAIFRQKGIIRVYEPDELYYTASMLAKNTLPKGNRVGIIATTGGGSVILLDKLAEIDMVIPELTHRTDRELSKIIADFSLIKNPLHLTTQNFDDFLLFPKALEIFVQDENLDAVIIAISMVGGEQSKEMAMNIIRIAESLEKPILTWWSGGSLSNPGMQIIRKSSVQLFTAPDQCVVALTASVRYKRFLENHTHNREKEVPISISSSSRKRIETILETSKRILTEDLCKEILSYYGIPITSEKLSRSMDEAKKNALEIGYPVALKIISPHIAHKTEIGGLRLSIGNDEELSLAYKQVLDNAQKHNPDAEIKGVLVQEMVKPGKEVILGMVQDPQFGPMIMFGLGGIFVEVLKDFSLRHAPLKERDAWEMIQEIKGYPVLKGFRGESPWDLAAIIRVLMAISQLAVDFKNFILSMDINPLVVYPDGQGVKVLDCLIVEKNDG
jgi:acetyltransferase